MSIIYKVTFTTFNMLDGTIAESESHYYINKDSIITDIVNDKNCYYYDLVIPANHMVLTELLNRRNWFRLYTLDSKSIIEIERLYTRDR